MIDYDAHDWRHNLFDIKGSMVRQIATRVLACVAWSAAVVAFHRHACPIAIPATAHSLVGVALGLLLVFRTNASYDRFWEARKQWGSIINETRNLGRAAAVLLAADPALVGSVVRWTIAFPYATMHSLRGGRGLGPIADELPAAEVDAALSAQHVPLAVAMRISALLAEARRRGLVSDYVHMQVDQNVQLLVDYLGACERIHRTPLPFAYVVHLRRSVLLYCLTLPFALLEPFRWTAVLCTLVVTYTFLGIEEIGVEIEDPFGEDDNDLPLERFCAIIQANLLSLMDRTRSATPDEAEPPQEDAPASPPAVLRIFEET